jgi:hypothetical protein
MQSYGNYTEEQQAQLKARNKELVGSMRHYDEIVSVGKKLYAVKGFVADRSHEEAIRPEYFQQLDGSSWALGPIDVVGLALRFKGDGGSKGMKTDWAVGAYPPGFHEASWEKKENVDFEPIVPATFVQS